MNQEAFEGSPIERWAYGLMGGFLTLMTISALTVWIDGRSRSKWERISEPTAVGEPAVVDFDPRDNPGREVLNWNGQPYFLQTNEPVKLPEFEALKIGKDDKGKIELYQAKKQNDKRVVLLKIGPDSFLRLTPR
jgi:hypothetical protein